jgi:hypothetical protein
MTKSLVCFNSVAGLFFRHLCDPKRLELRCLKAQCMVGH